MASTQEDLQKVQGRAKELNTAGAGYESAAGNLKSQVMEAVRADRAQRGISTMAQDVGRTLGQIPTDTAGIRGRAGDMVNPLEVDAITAAQRGQNLQTLGTQATQAEYNQGTLLDILGERSDQLKAMAASKYAEAQRAQQEAEDLWQQILFDEDVRRFNEELALKKASAGSVGLGDILSKFFEDQEGGAGIPEATMSGIPEGTVANGKVWMVDPQTGRGEWLLIQEEEPQTFNFLEGLGALFQSFYPKKPGGGESSHGRGRR